MSNKDNNHIVEPNKKISSVEWLIQQITANPISDITDEQWFGIMGQAKEMHKEEITNTYQHGIKAGIGIAANMEFGNDCDELTPDEFYQQTYGE